jgi:hypothetical protein
VRLVLSQHDLENEFRPVVANASRYIISVGGVLSAYPTVQRRVEKRLTWYPSLRYFRLKPDENSSEIRNYLSRVLMKFPVSRQVVQLERPSPMICANERTVVLVVDAGRLVTGAPVGMVTAVR